MQRHLFLAATVCVALALPQIASADLFTITDGDASFSIDPDIGGSASNTSLTVPNSPGGANWNFGEKWFLRVGGLTNELLTFRDSTDLVDDSIANELRIEFRERGTTTEVGGTTGEFNVIVTYSITETAFNAASLGVDVSVERGVGGPAGAIDVEVINYFDPNVYGTAGDDLGSVNVAGNEVRFDDGETGSFMTRTSLDPDTLVEADAFEINDASTLFSNISGSGNLSDSVVLNAGDLAGAFQWEFSLTNNDDFDFGSSSSSFAVPEPSTYLFLGVLGLGIGFVTVLRRRKQAAVNAAELEVTAA